MATEAERRAAWHLVCGPSHEWGPSSSYKLTLIRVLGPDDVAVWRNDPVVPTGVFAFECFDAAGQTLWSGGSDGPGDPSVLVLPLQAAGLGVDPRVLRDEARARIEPGAPVVGMGPDGSVQRPAIVNWDSWLWVDRSYWRPVTEEGSAPGGVPAVSVTATPVEARWVMGDGGSVTCTDPGVVWSEAVEGGGTSCSHRYVRDSSLEPGRVYKASVTVTWRFTWTLNGVDQGEFGTFTGPATGLDVRVTEVQVINTGGN